MLTDPGAAVVVMNHQSSIDLMSMFEMWPLFSFAGPIGKRELLFIQPFGLACWMCATEFLNRWAIPNNLGHYFTDEVIISGEAKPAIRI